jgi:hypothetical protein
MMMTDERDNSGFSNSGNLNSGDWNSGNRNSGNRNSGNLNSGYRNSGDWNSGYRNSGDWNSGDWNSGNRNSGFFCTETPAPIFFDKPFASTWEEAENLIPYIALPMGCEWVNAANMTDAEKESAPAHVTTGGFLRILNRTVQEAFPLAWAKLDNETKQRFLNLPNFDAEKFLECTGVDVRKEMPAPVPAPAIEAGVAMLIEGGMTKREVAALSIMAAIISNPGTRIVNFHVLDSGVIAPFLAKEAIALADALIAELDKGKDTENEMA